MGGAPTLIFRASALGRGRDGLLVLAQVDGQLTHRQRGLLISICNGRLAPGHQSGPLIITAMA